MSCKCLMKTVFLISMFGSFETDMFTVCHNKVPSDLEWSTGMIMTALSKKTTACQMYSEPARPSESAKNIPFSRELMRSCIILALPCETHWLQNDKGFWQCKTHITCFLMVNSCMTAATQYLTLVWLAKIVRLMPLIE